jgi:AcrR family transcriptional regulator
MERKEIQENRMKSYFVQATKELIKGEGLKSVSVRNIAERAGYSFATIYNYFKDVNDLVFLCVQDFEEECTLMVNEKAKHYAHGKPRIKAISKTYMQYFVEYPGIFELFFLEKMFSIGHKQKTNLLIMNFLDILCEEEWNYCIKNKLVKKADADEIKSALKYFTTGMLLSFINRQYPSVYADFTKLTEEQLDRILAVVK